MQTNYSSTSPYSNTLIVNNTFLDFLNIRPVPAESDDFLYTVEPQYAYRPDLLAYDLYGDSALWWVFIQRNMDVIQDPVFDFLPGVQIYIPKGSRLRQVLGI